MHYEVVYTTRMSFSKRKKNGKIHANNNFIRVKYFLFVGGQFKNSLESYRDEKSKIENSGDP